MSFFRKWLTFKWQRHDRAAPGELTQSVFASENGFELLYAWVDNVLLDPPRTSDPNEALIYTAQAAFIVDVIKALDQVQHPDKYKPVQIKQEGFNGLARRNNPAGFNG